MAKIHHFENTRSVIRHWNKHKYLYQGDILVIKHEKVVGIASKNWPVAVTEESGDFYQIHKEADLMKIAQILQWPLSSVAKALKEANKREFKISESFQRLEQCPTEKSTLTERPTNTL